MEIRGVEQTRVDSKIVCEYRINSPIGPETLWYSLSQDYADFISSRLDAPLTALLVPAMKHGEDIRLRSTISERLHYFLQGQCQSVLQTLLPSLQPVDIFAETIRPGGESGSGVLTGFSAGIDSFATLSNHYFNEPPTGFEITHLLFHNVGSHGADGERLFRSRFERLRPTAESIGLPFISVNSNVDAFYAGFDYQETHTIRGASVALLLQNGIKRYLYSSTFDYPNLSVSPTYDMAYADPVLLPQLSTEKFDAVSVGSENTRVEKTLQVAEIGESYTSLDICVGDSAGNCSQCWKCRRTLLTLEIAGLLDRYKNVFDLEAYRESREIYMGKVLASDDPLLKEIRLFARSQGFEFPMSAKLFAYTISNPTLREHIFNSPALRGVSDQGEKIVKNII